MNYQIVPATPLHVGPLASRLGSEAEKIIRLGGRPRAWLRWYMSQSFECFTGLVNDKPLAMWGHMGAALASDSLCWMCISDEARVYRKIIVRESLREMNRLSGIRHSVSALVENDDPRAFRFASWLGFKQIGTIDNYFTMTRRV